MILKSKDLVCGYGKKPSVNPVLNRISFDIAEGSKVAILGANGSGKTTLLRAIGGMLSYDGSLSLDEREVSSYKRKELSRMVAIMTQLSSIYFSYTVEETVMLGRYLYTDNIFGIPDAKDREVVEKCLVRNGLTDIRDKQIDELSGGQRQRVFLARTMAQQTPILLLDEPTNHLDLKYQAELMEYLMEWSKESTTLEDGRVVKNTLIGVFHDINMALSVCDEFIVMKDGQIIANGDRASSLGNKELQEAYGLDVENYMKKQLSLWK
ncbi:ABC transporter ATP-binding protein [Butyrivibrio proteoclasticus]|uniref:ABC transporter ATP-binding protein n=1 Tax=Butyrivibrio proteoclasticus TaxID=43305 RepID=UPI00068681B8|nr:ABC transporter ATP-binding protein [Butyrivibrio proteoclasticus]